MPVGRRRISAPLRHYVLVVVLATIVAFPLVTGTAGPSSSNSAAAAPSRGSPGGIVIAPAFVPSPSTVLLGPVPDGTELDVAVGVAGPSSTNADAALNLIDTPGTPEYHHYLSPETIASRFGPSQAAYAAAAAHFTAAGLSVQTSPDRTVLLVHGTATQVGAAFGTSFDQYREAGRTFFSHPTAARLPSGIPWSGALGLGNVTAIRPLVTRSSAPATPLAGCSGSSGYIPCQIEKAYNLTALLAGGANGSGYTLAVVDTYDGNEPQGQLATDLGSFESALGLAAGTVNYLYPVPTSRNLNATSTGWALEEALDLEWARAMAPAATIKMTFAPDPTAGLYGSVDWLVAHHAADVISLSWGEPDVGMYNAYALACASACNATTDGSYALLHPVLEDAALEGITVLAATGDCGAAGGTSGVSTDYPASDAFTVGVGATDLTLNASNGYLRESGWSGNDSGASAPGCQNQGGSGGGYSPFPRPYWQHATGLSPNGTTRAIPDVSINGGNGVEIVIGGFALPASGTSVSCPLWAGIVTDLDTFGGAPLGFITPSLYAIAAGSSGAKAFHDVTTGSNGYKAGVGWDAVTGLGSPNVGALSSLLARTIPARSGIDVALLAGPRFGSTPLTVAFQVVASGGTSPYAITEVDYGDFNTSLAPNGFSNHTYLRSGVYDAVAVVFDATGNSSVSTPVVVVVGGGGAINVTLSANRPAPVVGQAVTFRANVSGGTAPYTYNWTFGDGTYAPNGTNPSVVHSYGDAGPACVVVTVHDSGIPQNGAGSNRVHELVGGVGSGYCPNATAIGETFAPGPAALDLPGDFHFTPTMVGGTPPYTIQYSSNDSYVALCGCGIFRSAGVHSVTAYVNDSVNEEASVSTNLTLYPAMFGTFSTTVAKGPAPLLVGFRMSVGGGHGPNSTLWEFGDGQSAATAFANHTYATPGTYLAIGRANDSFGGNASEAFVIEVTNATVPPVELTATVSPAVGVPAGEPVQFQAYVASTTVTALTLYWSFSPSGFTAFGPTVTESFPYTSCLSAGTCPLWANLSARNADNTTVASVTIRLDGAEHGNDTGLTFTGRLTPHAGDAPFTVIGTASATGVPGGSLGWTFGDGGSASGSPVNHQYTVNGNYTATITAGDAGSDFLVHTEAIAGGPPGPGIVVAQGGPNVTSGVAPLRVAFSEIGLGGVGPPYTFAWTFGDLTNGTGSSPNHTYARPGHYDAYATASDALGTSGTTAYSITVYNGTDALVTLALLPNVTDPGQAVALVVTATPHCTPTSVPSCAAGNISIHATYAEVGATGAPSGFGSGSFTPVPLNTTGAGTATVNAPLQAGTYLVTAATGGRNYTGLAVAYLIVNATPPSTGPDRSLILLGAAGAVGVGIGIAAFVALRPRRPDPTAPEPVPPAGPNA